MVLYKSQRFISVYCQFVFLSGVYATTDVGRTFRREFTLVREVRTTAVSRRLRKTDWCFYSVFVKAHPAAVFVQPHSAVGFHRFLFLSISNKYSNPNTNVSLLASPYRKSSKLVNEDWNICPYSILIVLICQTIALLYRCSVRLSFITSVRIWHTASNRNS